MDSLTSIRRREKKYVAGIPRTDVEYTRAGGSSPNPYTGLDRFGRIIDLVWKQPSTILVQLKYGYDLASNRTYRRDEVARSHSAKFDELYFYDGLHRLNVFARGELNSGNNGFTSSATLAQAWTLDATGNWKGFDQLVDNPFTTTRTHNTVNEITGITTVSGSPTWDTPPAYDNNGNMTQMPSPLDVADTLEGVYDPWNRLVETDDATTVVVYAYDGLNRRITKASGGSTRHYYYSDQWQVLEERLDSDTTADRQYVWGLRYIDDLVLRDTPSERLYALQDALFNVVALTDDTGDVVERFAYQAYGQSLPLNPDYTIYSGTNYGWNYRFTGRELDLETGLQINRMRYLHLQLGRWVTRDPIGYEGSEWNLYEYGRGRPTNNPDALGLQTSVAGEIAKKPAEVVYWYQRGWSIGGIARKLGLTRAQVIAILRNRGLYNPAPIAAAPAAGAAAAPAVAAGVTHEQFVATVIVARFVDECADRFEEIYKQWENWDPPPPPPPVQEDKTPCEKIGVPECPVPSWNSKEAACRECNLGDRLFKPENPTGMDDPSDSFLDNGQTHYACKKRGYGHRDSIICGKCCVEVAGQATVKRKCKCAPKSSRGDG